MNSTPIITVILIAAIAGATFLAILLRNYRRGLLLGGVAGAGAGILGVFLIMAPLQFCTFEPEREPVDFWFGIGLIAIAVAGLLAIADWILRRFLSHQQLVEIHSAPGAFRRGWLAALFLAPTLIILALFLYYPFLDTFRLSTLLARLGIPRTAFICVDNFTRLIGDTDYYQIVLNTLVQALAIVFFSIALALIVALAAYQPVRGAKIYRTLLVWPYAISPVVAGLIFLLLFNPTGGIINYFLNNLFGVTIGWLNNPTAAPWAVILASIWKSVGFNILFYVAGLQNVPKDLLEASAIDGANMWQRFWRITFPMLSPITFFLIVTNTTYAFFDTFGTIDTLTGGGPLNSTTNMMYSIYEVGIQNNRLGEAAAQSLVLFALVIGLTILQFRTAGKRVNYGA